jgi:(1->4)-alpha-D-glucan 1-alpha-D-glucosylmutase
MQQLSGAAMAKGVEDNAYYRYSRFIALNEVGGDPSCFGISPEQFHDAAAQSQRLWPLTMLTTATHDSKRGEDVRTRLAVLSEQPGAWSDAVVRWSAMTQSHRKGEWPDRNTEYFFYQTLVGAWPVCADRLIAYMEKATREAKVHTSWTTPHADYDAAVRAFVDSCLADPVFMEDVRAFVESIVGPGRINSLAQTLLKLTSPGVPDLYQGTELWALHLVDPDNRRSVDYAERRHALSVVSSLDPPAILQRGDEGLPKIWVTHAALQLRQRRRDSFGARGSYAPVHAQGPLACHVVAFRRGEDVMTIVPRLITRAAGRWDGTTIPVSPGVWHNVLTGKRVDEGEIEISELWQDFPVALLERTYP